MKTQLTRQDHFFLILLSSITLIWNTAVHAGGVPNQHNIAINEVFYKGNANEDWIELINRGSEAVDISGWLWCARFDYPSIEVSHILSGNNDLNLEPGEIIALSATIDLDDEASDLGLYVSGPFISTTNMVDFIQWGTSEDIGRPDIAVSKTIWLEISEGVYDFVPTSTNTQSVSWCGSESGNNPLFTTSLDFYNGNQTQGLPNSLLNCDLIFHNGFE
ncbi:MAG: lamin tail domain-containing protein [Marinicellaceae bacterium]